MLRQRFTDSSRVVCICAMLGQEMISHSSGLVGTSTRIHPAFVLSTAGAVDGGLGTAVRGGRDSLD